MKDVGSHKHEWVWQPIMGTYHGQPAMWGERCIICGCGKAK